MRYFLLMGITIIIDQVTKVAVRENMEVGQSIEIFGDFFKLTHIENQGAALGLLIGKDVFLLIIPIIVVVAGLVFVVRSIYKKKNGFLLWPLSLIIGGGIGNLIDRTVFSKVTDMFDFSIFPPVFNVADIAVTIGCFLLMFYIIFEEKLK